MGKPHLEVGHITRPHGVRGEVKVHLHNADSDSLLVVQRVLLQSGDSAPREVRIEHARAVPRQVLLKLEGIADCNAAEALRGASVLVWREDLPPLAEGEVYLGDLVGAQVEAPDGTVGRVIEIRPYPSVDALVIELVDGSRAEQPLSEPWIAELDGTVPSVRLTSRDGLIT